MRTIFSKVPRQASHYRAPISRKTWCAQASRGRATTLFAIATAGGGGSFVRGVDGGRRKGFARALFAALVAGGKTFPRLALSADAASRPTSHGPYFKANGRRDASLRAGIGTRLVVFNASEHFFKFFPVQSLRLSALVLPGLER